MDFCVVHRSNLIRKFPAPPLFTTFPSIPNNLSPELNDSDQMKKEIGRRIIGISTNASNGISSPSCYVIYEVDYDEGDKISSKIMKGKLIYGRYPLFEGESKEYLRGDLYSKIQAAALLIEDLQVECVTLDGFYDELYK